MEIWVCGHTCNWDAGIHDLIAFVLWCGTWHIYTDWVHCCQCALFRVTLMGVVPNLVQLLCLSRQARNDMLVCFYFLNVTETLP